MTVSIIIPVWNDPDGVKRVLKQLESWPIFSAILVCDDASDLVCRPSDLGFDEAAMGITYLRSEERRGAGHARNLGLDVVETDHLLFFDCDDVLTEALEPLLREIANKIFDFCLFRHIDSRQRLRGVPGPMEADQMLWQQCGLLQDSPRLLDRQQAVQMAPIAAYPWNKIYRTAFLRDEHIRCTEIPVHNDIELHWTGFLKAGRIYASGALCCEHFVQERSNQLTNRRGRERLEVFKALRPLHDVLRSRDREQAFLVPMTGFYTRLFGWILETLEEGYHEAFYQEISAFLLENHSETTMALIANRDPALARQINGYIRRGWC